MIPKLDLPYSYDSLEPFISTQAMALHYEKYYLARLRQLNQKIQGTKLDFKPLVEIICEADDSLYHCAADTYNHSFFWQCLAPQKSHPTEGRLIQSLDNSFGSLEKFKSQFKKIALSEYGPCWVWLVMSRDKELGLMTTQYLDTPVRDREIKPLLSLDLNEHAYYIDFNHRRSKYIDKFWSFVNWSFVEQQFISHQAQ